MGRGRFETRVCVVLHLPWCSTSYHGAPPTYYGVPQAARDGDTDAKAGEIPDGFYLVADSTNPQVRARVRVGARVRVRVRVRIPEGFYLVARGLGQPAG